MSSVVVRSEMASLYLLHLHSFPSHLPPISSPSHLLLIPLTSPQYCRWCLGGPRCTQRYRAAASWRGNELGQCHASVAALETIGYNAGVGQQRETRLWTLRGYVSAHVLLLGASAGPTACPGVRPSRPPAALSAVQTLLL